MRLELLLLIWRSLCHSSFSCSRTHFAFFIGFDKIWFSFLCFGCCVDPLTIFVYRNGAAQFWSEPYSQSSKFSMLTNSAVKKNHPATAISTITRTIKDVLPILASYGINIEQLWAKIDQLITMMVISGIGFIETHSKSAPNLDWCFQIFGFDVLISDQQNPYLLDVNYRPSLDFDIQAERNENWYVEQSNDNCFWQLI